MSRLQLVIIVVLGLTVMVGVLVFGIGAVLILATPPRAMPSTVISAPANGTIVHSGDAVTIASLSIDPAGINRLDLLVDGIVVRSYPLDQPQTTFAAVQTWEAVDGTHTIVVRAINGVNQVVNSVSVSVVALPSAGPTTTIAPMAVATASATIVDSATAASPAPTGAPSLLPTEAAQQPSDATCTDNLAFVADMSIPDGTPLLPGQIFGKVWRVRNTGTCTWTGGYSLVYVGGEIMGAPLAVVVPQTPPGGVVDLPLTMLAPTTAGIHTGYWRLRSATGATVGVTLNATINVIMPAPIGCSGVPFIEYLTASAATINSGSVTTLRWGLVGNADGAEMDNGIGGVMTPGEFRREPHLNDHVHAHRLLWLQCPQRYDHDLCRHSDPQGPR